MKKVCALCGTHFEADTPRKLCDACKFPKCLHCGRQYETYYSRLKTGQGRYCSVACSMKHKPRSYWKGKSRKALDPGTIDKLMAGKTRYLEEYARENRVRARCEVCGKQFNYYPRHQKGRCCSRKCTAILGRRKVKTPGHPPVKTEAKTCQFCGAEFITSGFRARRRQFCSTKCFRSWNIQYQREHPQDLLYRARNGHRPDLGAYFRSSWEANFARYLNHIGKKWQFEPRRFTLRRRDGSKCYFWPDFLVEGDGYVEIKGYEHERGMSKLRLFREQYPNESIRLVDAREYARINGAFAHEIPCWEVTPLNIKRQPNKRMEHYGA